MPEQKKNPWLAAILNLVMWGLGYLYNGKRIAFGVMLLIASLSLNFLVVLQPSNSTATEAINNETESLSSFLSSMSILIPIALAYDAYKEAQEINSRKAA